LLSIPWFFAIPDGKVQSTFPGIALATLALALFALAGAREARADFSFGASAWRCLTDSEIDAADREAVEQVARTFVGDVLARRFEDAYDVLDPRLQKGVSFNTFKSTAGIIAAREPQGPLTLEHIYLVSIIGKLGSPAGKTASCTRVAGTSTEERDSVYVKFLGANKQAAVLQRIPYRDYTTTVTTMLVEDGGKWLVIDIRLNNSALLGKTSEDFLAWGQREAEAGHTFNGTFLVSIAMALTDRGPNFSLGIGSDIKKALEGFQLPEELKGTLPWGWKFGEDEFRITKCEITVVDGKYHLHIVQSIMDGAGDAEARNRALAKGFEARFPEYKSAFAGLEVEAVGETTNRSLSVINLP
jgi:hypothetical protein